MHQIAYVGISNCNFKKKQIKSNNNKHEEEIVYGGLIKSVTIEKEIYRMLGYDYVGINQVIDWNKVKAIIFDGQSNYYYWWRWCVKNELQNKLICEIVESEVVDYRCSIKSLKIIQHAFLKILTYQDDIIDNEKYFKRYINVSQELGEIKPYDYMEKKYLFAMIVANKKSLAKGELYNERKKIINFFEKKCDERFALFGIGWSDEIKCWKGVVKNKFEAYDNAKYAICLENSRANGYITEKIFDCFINGIVPIYGGAKNVEVYIPRNCFIDYFSFNNINEMISYAENLSIEEYNQYLLNINTYLKSAEVKCFDFKNQILNKIRLLETTNSTMKITGFTHIKMWWHLQAKLFLKLIKEKIEKLIVNMYHKLKR